MHVVNTLAPVFVLILLGLGLRRGRFFSGEFVLGLGRLCYWVALPCLLFHKIGRATLNAAAVGEVFMAFVTATGACIVLAYLVAVVLRVPGRSVGTFVQASFRGNLVYVGLPVILYALSAFEPAEAERLETLAILTLVPMVPIYNIMAVVVLLGSRHTFGPNGLKRMFLPLVTNPLLLSCVAGGVFSLTGLAFPPAVDGALESISGMALPLALLTIGGSLADARVRGRLRHVVAAPLIKVGVAPAFGYLMARLMGLGAGETAVLLIFLACPTAAASFVLAQQLEGDETLAASTVAVSTVLAAVSLTAAVAATAPV